VSCSKIISQALEINKKYRFLWSLGILLIISGLANQELWVFFIPSFITDSFTEIKEIPLLSLTLFLLIGLILFLLWLTYSSLAGLIFAVSEIKKKKTENSLNFRVAFRQGKQFFWPLLVLKVFFHFLIAMVLAIFISPLIIVSLTSSGLPGVIFAAAWGILTLLIVLGIILYLKFVFIFAERFIILQNQDILEGFRSSKKIVAQNLKEILVLALINLVVIAVTIFLFASLFILIEGILIGLVLLDFYLTQKTGYGELNQVFDVTTEFSLAIIGIGIFLPLSAFYYSFISSYWTLAFFALNKNK